MRRLMMLAMFALLAVTLVSCTEREYSYNKGMTRAQVAANDAVYDSLTVKFDGGSSRTFPFSQVGAITSEVSPDIVFSTVVIKVFDRHGVMMFELATLGYTGLELKRKS